MTIGASHQSLAVPPATCCKCSAQSVRSVSFFSWSFLFITCARQGDSERRVYGDLDYLNNVLIHVSSDYKVFSSDVLRV